MEDLVFCWNNHVTMTDRCVLDLLLLGIVFIKIVTLWQMQFETEID